jgi:hypothetical protein
MKTRTETMHGIPDDKIKDMVTLIQADPHYISHKVIPEGDGKNTVEATFRVDE